MSNQRAEITSRRLTRFAADVIIRLRELPKAGGNAHLRGQLFRSATAPGAHYGEARCAESRKDFIHKLSLGAKEMRETLYWMELIVLTNTSEKARWVELRQEGNELLAILLASIRTAKKNRK